MESVNEIKEALSARSRTATLDELANEGRQRVRLIRAEHVAGMIREAVHAAIEQSGLLGPEEVERLVDKSRQEFRTILREREAELQRAHDNEQALAAREAELAELQQRFGELSASLLSTRAALEAAQGEAETARQEAAAAQATASAAQAAAEAAAASAAAPRTAPTPAPAAGGPSPDLLLSLVQEMATLKANLMQAQAQAQPAPQPTVITAPAPAAPDFSAAFEKLAGSLGDRLEKLGKKMGVSAAVEGDAPVDFGGLFKDTGKTLESNMENIEVKQKAGGGIAANLARLKKLKGGS
jgi:chromosome segregation ATPase